jgi:hypothetical protein
MTDGLVLVTGAAGGRQGKSGRYVCELLRAGGVPVRAFVHTNDERSDHLRALGTLSQHSDGSLAGRFATRKSRTSYGTTALLQGASIGTRSTTCPSFGGRSAPAPIGLRRRTLLKSWAVENPRASKNLFATKKMPSRCERPPNRQANCS